jgi:hypothetical protein
MRSPKTSTYTLCVLLPEMARELRRSMPLKEMPAKELVLPAAHLLGAGGGRVGVNG